jgi:poly(3-hydroxybutyrate) depolymerase
MAAWRLRIVVLLAVAFAAVSASAQPVQSVAALQSQYNRLKAAAKPDGELKREIDAIDTALADAIRLGKTGEARRLLAKGSARLGGKPWTEVLDFAASIVLRADRLFVDPGRPFIVRIEQIFAPTLELATPLTARVTLRGLAKPTETTQGQGQIGDVVREIGTYPDVPRDLRDAPFPVDVDLAGIRNGRYAVVVELSRGQETLAARGLAIEVFGGLDGRLDKLAAAVGQAKGGMGARLRSDILYPADYIRRANLGLVASGEFDVRAELEDAEAVAASARAGKDPFAGRTGDMKRHYFFADAGEIMPYHLYVPTGYTGRRAVPLVVALHGNGATEDSFFQGPDRQLPALAEERGYIVVSPLGYRVDGGYGRTGPTPSQDPAVVRRRALSEADVMNVLDLVLKTYRVDPDRVYLFGHSMGAAGAWHLGAKYSDRWTALACYSGLGVPDTEQRMRHIPQLVVHGDADAVVAVSASRAMVAEMKRLGVEHRYIEVAGGDHYNVVEPYVRAAFDFFDAHRRKAAGRRPEP